MADALSYFLNRAKKLMRTPGTQKTSQEAKACLDVLTLESRIVPTGNYSGVVFQDYNGNGVRDITNTVANTSKVGTTNLAVDRGLGGVVVTAYDASGTAKGSATSKSDGTYTLASTGTGPYRIEFATASFPTNFTVGPIGPDNGSNVQFLPDGGSATVNLGLFIGTDYLKDNPTLVGGRLVFGDPAGANKNTPALVTFPYNSGANGATNTDYDNPAATTLVTVDKVGSIYGLAQNPETGTLYASAYTKKHSGWGPGGPGQIYAVNPTTGVVTNFVNLDTIFGAGTTGGAALATARGAVGYDYDRDSGNTGWDAVGKSGFGGSALSPDGSTLYVINLADRNIYAIPTSGPLTNVTIQRQLIPLNAPGATGTVAGDDLRPFAVTFYRGQLYVGITNTAEATGLRADLHSYVYAVNPTTLAFSAAPVFTVADLSFTRGFAANGFGGNPGGDWQAWRPTFATKGTNSGAYPQPMLSSIVFDANGNLTLGFRDRAGDQFGFFTLDNPASGTRFEGVAAGDNLFAAITTPNNLASGWTLESNGSAGSFTGFGPGNNQGPGNGEFFFDTFGTFHQEIATGAAIQLPGYPDVLSTGFDTGLDVRAGGLMWLGVDGPAATVGRKLKGYNLYQTGFPGNLPQNTPNFGKSNGLTNLTVVAEPAPIEIGNYVWKDANGNGIQDANEVVVSGLSVELWDLGADGKAGGGDDSKLGTAITNAAGQYYFSGFNNISKQPYYVGGLNILPNHNYQVRIPNATSKAGGAQQASITGLNPAPFQNDGSTDGVIRDSNAIVAADGLTGLINITTGSLGAISHDYDVGFALLQSFLGNEVWEDVNNNGQYDAGTDKLLQNITVNLLDSTGTFLKSQVTDVNGKYLFASLTPGKYRVEVVTPAGYTSSTGNGSSKLLSATGAYEPGTTLDAQNQFDHGTNTAGVGSNIRTTVVEVFAFGNAGNPDSDTLGNANAGNLRQDFGLVRTFSLGNRVWLDANNDGKLLGAEAGIGNVTVRLLDAAGVAILDSLGNPVIAITDLNGYYRFDTLAPGTYRVEVANSGVITTLRSSTGLVGIAGVSGPFEGVATPSPDTDVDSDDNGTLVGGNYRSGVVTLGPTNVEPIGEADLGPGGQGTVDAQSNLTVDFGFFRPMSLGNRVWIDANNNGKFDAGEANAPVGVLVNLLNSAGAPVLDAANAPITTLTNASGYYLFPGLNPGQYKVSIDKANFLAGGKLIGFTSSTGGGNGSTTGPNEPIAVLAGDNADSGTINGTLTTGGVIAATVTLVNGTATVNETGGNTTPGIADATADNDSELTVDFGFTPVLSLGNRVWNDLNNNGKFDAGEPAISGLTVRLLDSTGNPVLDGSSNPITRVTDVNGYYLFTNILAGSYIVEVVPPAGFVSSTGVQGSTNGAFEPGVAVGGTSNDGDHGTSVGSFFAPTGIRSGVINLQPGTTTIGEPATPGITDPALDANSETTVDFGLFRPLSLGNRVWIDANNNGLFDAGEAPGAGVTVQLLDGAGVAIVDKAGTPVTTVTSAKGWYLFTGLGEGNYKVAITAANFAVGGALEGFTSSTGGAFGKGFYEVVAGLPGNNKDSGNISGVLGTAGFVVSNLVTLAVGTAPTAEDGVNGITPGLVDPARDIDSNATIDFGFFKPLSLGNFVWNDKNNNGKVDGTEAGIAGVTVNLYQDANNDGVPDGAVFAVTATNASGSYLFTGLGAGSYIVEIDAKTLPAGVWLSSTGKNGSPTGPNEGAATPDPDLVDTNNQDVGTTFLNNTDLYLVRSKTIDLAATTEPTNDGTTPGITDGTPNADSNLTADFGFFQPLSLGNLVWDDLNNNGKLDAAEPGLAGVVVSLFQDVNADGKIDIADGAAIATMNTNANGSYLFTGLGDGSYLVEITAPATYISSTGTVGKPTGPYELAPAPDTDIDNDDNGSSIGGSVIRSGLVTLSAGTEPTGEPATPGIADGTPDKNSNTTVDFGLFQPLSIGNRVWDDLNNDGLLNNGEVGVANVPVRIFDSATNTLIDTQTTDANGYYLFTNLVPGDYYVEITPPTGYVSSTGGPMGVGPFEGANTPSPNTDVDGDDNGTQVSATVIRSGTITLARTTEPTGETDVGPQANNATDANSNLTLDLGVFRPLSLGNFVWWDKNNSGTVDAADGLAPGIAGVTVNLYLDANDDGTPDSATPYATTKTNANGSYLFTGLAQNTFIVEIDGKTLPAGFWLSSTGLNGSLTGPNEGALTPDVDGAADTNNTDVGTTFVNNATQYLIRSKPVTLTVGGEPTGDGTTPGITDTTPDANSNLRADFGFFRPVAVGNLVWNDKNNNCKVDAGEAGLPGVTANLFDAGNKLVLTTTTDKTGNYLFNNLGEGTYFVEILPPAGYLSSTGKNGSTTGPSEPAPSPEDNVDNNDDGTTTGVVIRSGGIVLTAGGEPTGEVGGIATTTPDDSSNQTVDFGLFIPLTLGNLVWNDINNNGVVDAGEPGLVGVPVSLFADANGDGVPDGPALLTTVTNAQGSYLFTNLADGGYVVEITPPAKFISSSGKNGFVSGPFEAAPTPNNGTDNDDNGSLVGANIRSGTVVLSAGTAPIGEPATPGITDGTPDKNANYTVDFGVYRPLSLGNLVWNDLNNNGIVDAGETGVANVVVTLLTTTGTVIATTTTAADGGYNFSNLTPGDYVVQIAPPAGYISSTGGTNGSGPYEVAPGPNNDVDNDDNGTLTGTVIVSTPVTLTIGGEPANGGDTNPTVDFGILQPMTIGNLVFNDANNNGKADTGEVGIAGIRVRIYRDDNKDGIPDGAALGTVTTNANGSYLFAGLGQGGYIIEVDGATVPAGLVTSSGKNASAVGPFEPAPSPGNNVDGDDNGTKSGTNFRSGPVMLMLGTNPTGEPVTPGITDGTPDNNSNATVDFGFYQPLSFGNTIWRDDNNNGKLDTGEVVYPNIPVRIFDSTGALVASTTTGANGTYKFDLLNPGTYTVEITPPAGVLPSTPVFDPLTSGGDNLNIGKLVGTVIRSQPITLAVGKAPLVGGNTNTSDYVTGDFGLLALAMVSGYVYRDPDLNGTYTPGVNDTPIGGVTIVLTGTDAGGQPVPPRTMTTDSKGFYKFTDLPPGTYNIRELPPAGFLIKGADNVGSLGGTNPSVANLTVTLNANDNGLLYNFGHYTPSALFGNVYVDVNGNCVRDIGEPGIAGVPIVISGTAFAGLTTARPLTAADVPGGLTVFTNGEGRYEFPVLPPGNYTVNEATQPAAYADGCEQNGDPSAPAPTVTNDNFSGVSLNPAQTRGPLNFGEIVLDPTKRQFLSSTLGGTGLPVSTNAPRADVQLNPSFTVTTGTPTKPAFVVTAAGAGTSPLVRVFDYATGGEVLRFLAYENAFTGGVRAATGDVDGDGTPDIITGIGVGGGPRVRVFSGKTGASFKDFFAYEPTFTGGLFVAAGDVNGDGKADIITGVEVGGGPRVQVFDGVTLQPLLNFFAFDSGQRGGVRVASGDFDGDGRADIVTTTGVGVATLVRVYSSTGGLIKEFAPYNSSFTGGVSLAVGDFNGDGYPDIVTGAEAGGGPHVQIFDGKTTTSIASFFAYDSTFTGGVRVSTRDVNGDGKADIITAPASASPSRIRVVNAATLQDLDTFFAFDPDYLGGSYVG